MYTFLSVLISRIIPQIWIFEMELAIKIYRDFDFLEDKKQRLFMPFQLFYVYSFIREEFFWILKRM